MEVFGDYSRYYNLLYQDKDYAGEADFIENLIRGYAPNAKTILDLGCGTGRHAKLLSEKGYMVHGIDMSEEMLSEAERLSTKNNLTFSLGDVRSARLNKKFDVVTSLFHVMSYQVTNKDLTNALITAFEHLDENGIFIFDCWYGPAVLTDRPTVRIKRLNDAEVEIIRIAEPEVHTSENVVDVNYQILIRRRLNGKTTILKETHKMRYLFIPEVKAILDQVNFKMLTCEEWMSQREPGFNSWNVFFVVKK